MLGCVVAAWHFDATLLRVRVLLDSERMASFVLWPHKCLWPLNINLESATVTRGQKLFCHVFEVASKNYFVGKF